MEVNTDRNDYQAGIVTSCPWQAGSRDPQALFGTRLTFTPWGWSIRPDGSLTNTITEEVSQDRPLAPAIEENFTFKAFGAKLCLQDINTFVQTWLSAASGDLPGELAPSIDRVRTAATALVACAPTGDQELRSSLDTLQTASRIIAKYPGHKDPAEGPSFRDIESLSESTWHLLQMIKGFCVRLQEFSTLNVATATSSELRQAWKAKDLDTHSVAIDRFSSDHNALAQVNSLKASTSTESMSVTAHRLAKDYMSARNGARRKLDALSAQTPWEASIVAVKWNSPLPHVSRLSTLFRYRGINRHQILVSTSNRPDQPRPWEPGECPASIQYKGQVFYFHEEDTLQLYPGSTIQLQLQYIDDNSWRRGTTTQPFDTAFVFGSDIRKRVPGTKRFETARSKHVLELDMPPSDISKEYERLDKCHWTSLLTAGPLPDADNPHKLLFEPPSSAVREDRV